MKQKPILFNTEMVQAILAGRKTQTRRVVKPQPIEGLEHVSGDLFFDKHTSGILPKSFKCPYGGPGDVLWVREAWRPFKIKGTSIKHMFKAGQDPDVEKALKKACHIKWKPSIHMPKDAARIWLRIKDVRVERLRDISHEDIRAEGAAEFGCTTHRLNWQTLWESVNGSDSWKDNPWVWVIEFERIEKP